MSAYLYCPEHRGISCGCGAERAAPSPAPWRVHRTTVLEILDADGRLLAGTGTAGETQDEADTRMMAAAPEMAECLRDHVRYFDCKHPVLAHDCCTCEAKRLLRVLQVA